MANTTPQPKQSNKNVQGTKKPSNHKSLLVILLILVAVAVGLFMYATYSSSRNDADGATESRRSDKVNGSNPQSPALDVASQQKATKQPVSEVGQETTVKLYASSGKTLVNTVQATINYPADALELVAITNGTAFPAEYATDKSIPGVVKIVRAVANQAASVKGDQIVVTLTFKKLKDVKATSVVVVDKNEAYLVTSSDNRNLISSGGGSLSFRP